MIEPSILTVSQLNRQIRTFLEIDVGEVHVEGEVSTLSKPSSGHYYFTLKDSSAQIRCVFFKNRKNVETDTHLQVGQKIIARGQLSLYEARGDYQLIVEQIENAGIGNLHHQFEQLKTKLLNLGLFDTARKKPLPSFPKVIAVITSSSGAALRDILVTLERRYPLAEVHIYHSEVQGKQAPQQLISALNRANVDQHADVIILARGGGSIEDLWGFNDEGLALAIAKSIIPIVSGVGHETDFTIADFVADVRAATPTAAAEAVSPHQHELQQLFRSYELRIKEAMSRYLWHKKLLLTHEMDKISSPGKLIFSHWQTLDYLLKRLQDVAFKLLSNYQHQLEMLSTQLTALSPLTQLAQKQQQINYLQQQLLQQIQTHLQRYKTQFGTLMGKLHLVSPLATLARGYAIASFQNHILMDSSRVKTGDSIQLLLAKGKLICEVTDHA